MNVKLISVTPDAEKIVLYTARVSNPKNQESENTKLIDYCIKNAHWSVFEMAHMTVEIKTSRAISAQILRHKSFSFQEFSLRYAQATEFEFYDARRQDKKNRQNSIADMSQEDMDWFDEAQRKVVTLSKHLYEEALHRGVAKESARMLLPLSTSTTVYMTGNIRSFLHYLDLRCDGSTQLEHQEIALAIRDVFVNQFPIIAKAKGWL